MRYASPQISAIVCPMPDEKGQTRVSVDLPAALHEKFFKRCRFTLGNLSMNKRIIQLVRADVEGRIDVAHEPPGK